MGVPEALTTEKRYLSPKRGRTSNLVLANETFQPSSYRDLSSDLRCTFSIHHPGAAVTIG